MLPLLRFCAVLAGKGAGSLIGGYLMKLVGTRNTYRVFAAGALGAGVVYFLFNRFYLRHRAAAKQDEKGAKASDKDHEACAVSRGRRQEAGRGAAAILRAEGPSPPCSTPELFASRVSSCCRPL